MSAQLVDLAQAKAYVDVLLDHITRLEQMINVKDLQIAAKDEQLRQQGATLHTSVSAQSNLNNAAAEAIKKLGGGHGRRAITSGQNSAHSGPRACKRGPKCKGSFEKDGQLVYCWCDIGQEALKAAQPAQ
jgi:uncharacterized protein (DUF3084 family)